MPFLTAVAVMALVVWKILGWRNAGMVEALEHRLQLRDDEIADYKRKLGGDSPDQAKDRLDALEAIVRAISPRRITAEVRQRIAPILSAGESGLLELNYDVAAGTMIPLCEDLARILEQSGWHVDKYRSLAIGDPSASGISITLPDLDAHTPPQAALLSALKTAGLQFDLRQGLMPQHEPGSRKPDAVMSITSPKTETD